MFPPSNMEGKVSLLILAGPSGVGKTSVADSILKSCKDFYMVRSATTRAPRGDGHDGEYLYYSEKEFEGLISDGCMIEYMSYGGNLYGTPRSELDNALREGRIPLLILDTNGVESFSRFTEYPSCIVYVYAEPDAVGGRLYRRYLCPLENIADLSVYVRRLERNISDFMELPRLAPLIYSFAYNGAELSDAVAQTLSAYDSFCRGIAQDSVVNAARADWLYRLALRKKTR